MNKTISVSTELKNIAQQLKEVKHEAQASKLLKIAQNVDGMQKMQQLYNEFDPSQEKEIAPVQNYADESPGAEEISPNSESQADPEGKVPIESFIKMNGEPQTSTNFLTHNCGVVFKAPSDVEESDMMNYILGIGKALGVEVVKFDWEKLEDKIKK